MANITQLVLAAILVEALVTNITWVAEKQFDWKRLVALVVSVAFCVLASIDAFSLFGFGFIVPYVGSVFTGIIVARGANGIRDLLNLIIAAKAPIEARAESIEKYGTE